MKKLIALLLVLCMVAGLVACKKKPVETPDGTTGSQSANQGGANNQGGSDNNQGGSNNDQATTGTEGGSDNGGSDNGGDSGNSGNSGGGGAQTPGGGGDMGSGIIGTGYTGETLGHDGGEGLAGSGDKEITNNDDLINPAFSGKTLQIYGYSAAKYDYIEDMGLGNYIWMMRAAVDEWAALNNVRVIFEGDYDQNALMGAINSGAKPDILLECDQFPAPANVGLLSPFTEEEYKTLSNICGEMYLDVLKYKGQSYGIQKPWAGNIMFYYNKTMFEEYGVKTPKEYYMEDNWTWDNFEKCMIEMTKDLDGDGEFETYGCGDANVLWLYNTSMYTEAEDGTLSHNFNTDAYRRLRDIYYNGLAAGYIGPYSDCDIATSPRPAMHTGDASWYNFEHLNRTIENGDVIETIFPPTFDGVTQGSNLQFTQAYMSIFSCCDEREAAMSLLQYILRVGLRYMSEFSNGIYACDYEGIRGVTEYSLGWRKNFQARCENRKVEFEELGDDWDQDMWNKMFDDIMSSKGNIGRSYPGVDLPPYQDLMELPAASAVPLIIQDAEQDCENYNNLYINKAS